MPTLSDLLPAERVTWFPGKDRGPATTKDEALSTLLKLASSSDAIKDPVALRDAVLSREVMMSTGLGYGIAVPHARVAGVDRFVLSLGVSADGIVWGSPIDDDPVRLVVMIAGPLEAHEGYLRVLSTTLKFIKSEKGKVLHSTSAQEISRLARAYDLPL